MVQILLEHCGRSWSPLIFLFIILLLFFLFHAVTTPHTPSPGPRVRVTPGTLPRAGTTAHHEARHWHWPAEGTRGGTLRAPLERLSRGSCLAAALANQLVLRPVLLLSEHTNCFPVWRLGRTGGGGAREAMAQELSAISDPGNGAAGNGVATAVAIRQRSSEREQQAPFLRPRHSLSCWPPLPPARSPAPPRRITQHTFRHTCVRARQQVGGSVSAVPVVSNRGRWWRRWARGK